MTQQAALALTPLQPPHLCLLGCVRFVALLLACRLKMPRPPPLTHARYAVQAKMGEQPLQPQSPELKQRSARPHASGARRLTCAREARAASPKKRPACRFSRLTYALQDSFSARKKGGGPGRFKVVVTHWQAESRSPRRALARHRDSGRAVTASECVGIQKP